MPIELVPTGTYYFTVYGIGEQFLDGLEILLGGATSVKRGVDVQLYEVWHNGDFRGYAIDLPGGTMGELDCHDAFHEDPVVLFQAAVDLNGDPQPPCSLKVDPYSEVSPNDLLCLGEQLFVTQEDILYGISADLRGRFSLPVDLLVDAVCP